MNNIPKCINIVNNSQMFLVIFKLIKIGNLEKYDCSCNIKLCLISVRKVKSVTIYIVNI